MVEFALALPAIRRRVEADLKKKPLSREHVLATIIALLEKTLIRIGNEEYARANKSFGLTTLRDQHVTFKRGSAIFHFRAKSGVIQTIDLEDPTLARLVKNCRDVPGPALFQFIDDEGRRQCVDSADVNAYLKDVTGKTFTAKNFRTWAGTVLVAEALCDVPPAASEAAFKRNIVKAVDAARSKLGNTRAVCRNCYVHPAVFEAYRSGVTLQTVRKHAGQNGRYFSPAEAATLALLRDRAQHAQAA
jgi:DNA topoisomerase-1